VEGPLVEETIMDGLAVDSEVVNGAAEFEGIAVEGIVVDGTVDEATDNGDAVEGPVESEEGLKDGSDDGDDDDGGDDFVAVEGVVVNG